MVTRKTLKLSMVEPDLRGCHVVIEACPKGSQRPNTYRVLVHLQGGTEAVRRGTRHAHGQNLHAALGEVFRAVRRQLTPRDHRSHASA
jgi:ribosome-associated translation inhibitor RaiA